jgi:hypothetical protein
VICQAVIRNSKVDLQEFPVATTLFAIALEGKYLPRKSDAPDDAPMFCDSHTAAGKKWEAGGL